MDKDKQIQKIAKYSIDKIAAKSTLATRGLRELGLLKDKKHFTIIYTCQFCGRLINYSSTPCAFCCNFPKTKREVIVAQALSSESMEIDSLLAVSKAVKDGEDLEIVIANLRDIIDDVLENPSKFSNYPALFKLTEFYVNNPNTVTRAEEINNKIKIFCNHCNNEIILADKPCFYCTVGKNENIENNLMPLQKNIVALNGFLLFAENYLDFSNDKDSMTELIFVSVYLLNRLLEKDELPDKDLKKYWRELLLRSEYFGSEKTLGAAIEIDANAKPSMVLESAQDKVSSAALNEMIRLIENIIYLLKI
ncbi:MAG TPA: hypothetical protein PKN73_02465 [Candidatus Paceibacterota bacterium]|jgi:hypothetical protein|nr:hypothetical protein [Candidatus Pacearchaeota archaeon]HNZ55564.1 hypothetical protein [Candidatus Paceibacterota bacterium]